ncbi:MAG: L,D-transpeptidase [Alphaproteobacteria bacterium]|nr:L,D-transpeptidase [Alphaproteobacteria bacterium]
MAELFVNGQLLKTYVVSTAAKGLGCESGSNKTPIGLFRVSEKFGANALPGTVFKSRLPTGEVWSKDKNNPLRDTKDDLILTRILWLEGCESRNANTKDRYIYIHGTNREDLLGTPASLGCVRISNQDIIELFDLMPEGSGVEIRYIYCDTP